MTAPGHLVFPAGTWPRKKSLIYPLDIRWFSSWLCKRLPEGSWFYILRTINGDIVFSINWLYHMFGWTHHDSPQSSQNRPGLRSLWAPGYLVFPGRSRHLFGFSTWRGKDARPERRCARVVMRTWPGALGLRWVYTSWFLYHELTLRWVDMSWHKLILYHHESSWIMKTVRLWWIVAFQWQHMLETFRRFIDLLIPFYPTVYDMVDWVWKGQLHEARQNTLCAFRWISVLSKL